MANAVNIDDASESDEADSSSKLLLSLSVMTKRHASVFVVYLFIYSSVLKTSRALRKY